MAFRINKPEDLAGVNLPEDIKAQLLAELVPRGLPPRRGPWEPVRLAPQLATQRSEEFRLLTEIYIELLKDHPDRERLVERIRARLRDISGS